MEVRSSHNHRSATQALLLADAGATHARALMRGPLSEYTYSDALRGADGVASTVTFFIRGDTMIARWGAAALEEPYLIGVDSLAFEYFERDGTPITDPTLVTSRAASARVTIRTKGEATATERTLVGRVRLRNSRF